MGGYALQLGDCPDCCAPAACAPCCSTAPASIQVTIAGLSGTPALVPTCDCANVNGVYAPTFRSDLSSSTVCVFRQTLSLGTNCCTNYLEVTVQYGRINVEIRYTGGDENCAGDIVCRYTRTWSSFDCTGRPTGFNDGCGFSGLDIPANPGNICQEGALADGTCTLD